MNGARFHLLLLVSMSLLFRQMDLLWQDWSE
jgi:hypothetical protein